MKHITRDGVEIDIKDMSDNHLINTILLYRRRAQEGVTVARGGGSTAEEMWYDEDVLYGREALVHLNYDAYVHEANRRGIIMKGSVNCEPIRGYNGTF